MTKITLDNEYRALESLIENNFPTLKVLSYNPKEPKENDVVFELIDSSSEEHNRIIVKKLRTYQLLFYFDKQTIAMRNHSSIDDLFEETSSFLCLNRFIKIESYSMSRIFKTASGKFSFYCIIEAYYHSSRTFEEVPKMASINATINE